MYSQEVESSGKSYACVPQQNIIPSGAHSFSPRIRHARDTDGFLRNLVIKRNVMLQTR